MLPVAVAFLCADLVVFAAAAHYGIRPLRLRMRGRLTRAECVRVVNGADRIGHRDYGTALLRYRVPDGLILELKVLRSQHPVDPLMEVGQSYPVVYLPANPRIAMLGPRPSVKNGVQTFLFGLLVLALAVFLMVN